MLCLRSNLGIFRWFGRQTGFKTETAKSVFSSYQTILKYMTHFVDVAYILTRQTAIVNADQH